MTANGLAGAVLGGLVRWPAGWAEVAGLKRERVELELLEGVARPGQIVRWVPRPTLPAAKAAIGRCITPLGASVEANPLTEHEPIESRLIRPRPFALGTAPRFFHTGVLPFDLLEPVGHGQRCLLHGDAAPSIAEDILSLPRAGFVVLMSTRATAPTPPATATVVHVPPQSAPALVLRGAETALVLAQNHAQASGDAVVIIDDMLALIDAHVSSGRTGVETYARLGSLLEHVGQRRRPAGANAVTLIAGIRQPTTPVADEVMDSLRMAFDRVHAIIDGQPHVAIRYSKFAPRGSPPSLRPSARAAVNIIAAGQELQPHWGRTDAVELDEATEAELRAYEVVRTLTAHRLGCPRTLAEVSLLALAATYGHGSWENPGPSPAPIFSGISLANAKDWAGLLLAFAHAELPEVVAELDQGTRPSDETVQRTVSALRRFCRLNGG